MVVILINDSRDVRMHAAALEMLGRHKTLLVASA